MDGIDVQVQNQEFQSSEGVQSVEDQGSADQQPVQTQDQPQQQQPIDYEKAYKNLEREFTKRSQKLKQLEAWEKFSQETGITAEMALQQLEAYKRQFQQQAPANDQAYVPPVPPSYHDPRIDQLEQKIQELTRERQIQTLRQKFPQFDEYYADIIDLADSQGLDLETAFGKFLVNNWDTFKNQIEKRTVDTIRAKGLKNVETSQAPDEPDPTASLTPEELEAAKLLGIDPKDYAAMKDTKYLID